MSGCPEADLPDVVFESAAVIQNGASVGIRTLDLTLGVLVSPELSPSRTLPTHRLFAPLR
jgi:hypothetical protein